LKPKKLVISMKMILVMKKTSSSGKNNMRVNIIRRMNWPRGKAVLIGTSSKEWRTGSVILFKMTMKWMKKRMALRNKLKVEFLTIKKPCLPSQILDYGRLRSREGKKDRL